MKPAQRDYDVLAKWDSPSFDDTTRAVLARRLHALPTRRFFTEGEWRLLEAVAARVLPQPERRHPIPLVPWVDELLAERRGEGFRYEGMPPLQAAWRQGLSGIDAEAGLQYGRAFTALSTAEQDTLLARIAANQVTARCWQGLDALQFFRHHLLKSLAGFYYAHPAAWSEIGFGGPASPRGYVRLGIDQRDSWESP